MIQSEGMALKVALLKLSPAPEFCGECALMRITLNGRGQVKGRHCRLGADFDIKRIYEERGESCPLEIVESEESTSE
jgi:hypothetical protein